MAYSSASANSDVNIAPVYASQNSKSWIGWTVGGVVALVLLFAVWKMSRKKE